MKKSYFLFAVALIFMVIVLADLFLWFAVADDAADFEVSREKYLSYYPDALHNARLLTVISIMMLTFAGFIFLNARKNKSMKAIAGILGVVSALLLMWKLFSLM